MRRSGEGSPRSGETGALKHLPRGGRRATEETVDGDASRRSSQQSQAGDAVEDAATGALGEGTMNADHDSDWEILHHTGALGDEVGCCANGEHHLNAGERPISPGVDFTTAYLVDKEGGLRKEEFDGAREGEGKRSCKWEDAASIHSFLVRGPTYLQVSLLRPVREHAKLLLLCTTSLPIDPL